MNFTNPCLKIAEMLQHFQADNKRKLILTKRQTAGVTLDDFHLVVRILPRQLAGVGIVF